VARKTKCQVYSRVTGYLSPISQWNEGKKAEWEDRKNYEAAGGKKFAGGEFDGGEKV